MSLVSIEYDKSILYRPIHFIEFQHDYIEKLVNTEQWQIYYIRSLITFSK